MKIAIVGAQGYVGSHIAAEAMRRGWMVTPIGRKTPLTQLREADAVVHTVGTFMEDQRYKKLLSSPISLGSMMTLGAMRLGFSSRNPMIPKISFDDGNFKPAAEAALALKPKQGEPLPNPRIPFVYISAADSIAVEKGYLAAKRKAENFLSHLPYLRAISLRPGFIGTKDPIEPTQAGYKTCTPRNLVDKTLRLVGAKDRVTVEAVAEAACDAIEDPSIEGIVSSEVIRHLE